MALVRVKRRLTDDPADALLVTSKKLKFDDDLLTTVFKFAATVKKDEEISSVLKRVLARDSKFKDEVTNVKKISEKMQAENRRQSSNNRLKVVNCFRSLDYKGEGEGAGGGVGGSRPLTVLHAESSLPAMDSCNLTKTLKEAEDDYVFDLYFTNSLDICDSTMESIISAIPVENDLLFDNYRGASSEEYYDCDEDSNDENHWKNDYPEDDDHSLSSIDEDDMRMAVRGIRRMIVDSDGELRAASSSEEDEDNDWIYDDGEAPSRKYVFGDSEESDETSEREDNSDPVLSSADDMDN